MSPPITITKRETRTRNPDGHSKQAELENENGAEQDGVVLCSLTAIQPRYGILAQSWKGARSRFCSVLPRQLQKDDDAGAAVEFWNLCPWRNRDVQDLGHNRNNELLDMLVFSESYSGSWFFAADQSASSETCGMTELTCAIGIMERRRCPIRGRGIG